MVVALLLINDSAIVPVPPPEAVDIPDTEALVQEKLGVGLFVVLDGLYPIGILLHIAEGVKLLDKAGVGFTLTDIESKPSQLATLVVKV